jgi:LAGLIDADG endonuclease
VGLIEGDGWFSVSKKGKYVMYEFGIELSIRDVQLIYKIKDILGVGTVFFRERKFNKEKCNINKVNSKEKANMVMYRIRNKSHLKNIIIPIFDKYPFFSNKQYDYVRFRTFLLSDVIYSKDLINYVRPSIPLNSVESIIKSSYFSA